MKPRLNSLMYIYLCDTEENGENEEMEHENGDDSSPFVDEDDVITLLSLFDSILMEDEIGHEKLVLKTCSVK